jgi:hypothetical protein
MKIVRNASVAWRGGIKSGRARAECPVSKLFNAPISLDASLVDQG